MSFETDIQSRLNALGVTPEVTAAMRTLAPLVRDRGRPILESYFESWRALPPARRGSARPWPVS